MIYSRGHPEDFNNWANITGDPRWGYENVLKYYKKSEDFQSGDSEFETCEFSHKLLLIMSLQGSALRRLQEWLEIFKYSKR